MKNTLYALLYRFRHANPVRLVALGYCTYIFIGWLFLCLPFTQKAHISLLDNLFIATSAVSTTGLATVTVNDSYTFWGQVVILTLIQLGGIGYMTFGSFVILSTKRQLQSDHKAVMQTVFSIPKGFRIEDFIVAVVGFTFLFEFFGVLALLPVFIRSGVPYPFWQAVFHSVSAFCTAGFSLFPDSFEGFKNHVWLNVVISILSIAGAMGFIVCLDVWKAILEKSRRITLTTKIILVTTFWLLVSGTAMMFITEPFTVNLHAGQAGRLLYSFFQIMTALTTVGFNTVPIRDLSSSVIMLLMILMVIGASPSGTGGGLKTTTFTAIIGLLRSTCQGEREVRFWGAFIPWGRVHTAVATFSFYIGALTIGIYLMMLTGPFSFQEVAFECASALGTVGLSMGITASLSHLGKMIVIFLMLIGRISPLTFGVALFMRSEIIFDDEQTDLVV